MKTRHALAALGLLSLAACGARTVAVEIAPDQATYSRDRRTGLCFAAFGRGTGNNWLGWLFGTADSFSITGVPCSPEVLALVPARQREGGR